MTCQTDAVHFGNNHVAMTTYSIPRSCSHVAITTDGTYLGSDHVAIATYLLYIFVITMLL